MTIGTYTFYTITRHFAIDICGFFQIFFEFIMNFALILLKSTKRNKFFMCQSPFFGFSPVRNFFAFFVKSRSNILCIITLNRQITAFFAVCPFVKKTKNKSRFLPESRTITVRKKQLSSNVTQKITHNNIEKRAKTADFLFCVKKIIYFLHFALFKKVKECYNNCV